MALNNLKGEATRRGVRQTDIAQLLGLSVGSVNKKLAETVPMTTAEIKTIRDEFFEDRTLDYLLESDNKNERSTNAASI